MTYFKDGWAGSHNFKVGGEWFRETFTDERGIDVNGSVPGRRAAHSEQRSSPAQVYLFATPSISEQGLRTLGLYVQDTWRLNSRLTFNLGIRFDRYRNFLPEQEGPPVGRFNTTQVTFPEVSNANTFNNPVPRLGMVFDLTGQGRTVLKANYALYAWNPGHRFSPPSSIRTRQTGTGGIRGPTPTATASTTRRGGRDHRAARRRDRARSIRTSRTP